MRRAVFFALCATVCLWAVASWAAAPVGPSADLRAALAAAKSSGLVRSAASVERFYAARQYRPAWSADHGAAMRELRVALAGAADHGLTAPDYDPDEIGAAIAAGKMALADILATDGYLTFAGHLMNGRVDPVSIEPAWAPGGRSGELIAHLEETLRRGDIERRLDRLAPTQTIYRNLQTALRIYRAAASPDRWPPIAPGPLLKLGAEGPRVAALRRRLIAEGLLPKGSDGAAPPLYDRRILGAVAGFQIRAGLKPDGIVGPNTRRELNRTRKDRIGQIRANLERLRWLPDDLGARHIRVNVADYRLQVWQDGKIVKTHDVIVGRPYRKTPIFSADISYVIFNPWWFTPDSIARKDKIGDFRTDPGSIQRLGYEIADRNGNRLDAAAIDWNRYSAQDFPFRIRQRPGPMNALGRVKLMLPNRFNVYLHDTPAQELFDHVRRDFSSGCVRVGNALDLATWALSGVPGWDRTRIDAVVASGGETRVDLPAGIPVHFLYLTALGDPDTIFRFVNDVYGRDPRLIAALDKPPPPARTH